MTKQTVYQSEKTPINRLFWSMPFWWIGVKGYSAAMLPSKTPDIGIYSYPKFLALCTITLVCFLGIKYIHPYMCILTEKHISKIRFKQPSPISLFIFLFLITSIIVLPQGIKVGEDISEQVLSSYHYAEKKINAPNIILRPLPTDLSKDETQWHVRPPGASWIALPGLFVGFSLGKSIQLSLFIIGFLTGIGWLRLSKKLGMRYQARVVLAILLSIAIIGLNLSYFGTMNSSLLLIVPWMILLAMFISQKYLTDNSSALVKTIVFGLFYFMLGSFCLLKMSGMIAALTIGLIPFAFIINKKISKVKIGVKLILLFLSPVVFLPTILQESFTETHSGISSHEMYSNIDYNEQISLWGEHFIESTKGSHFFLNLVGGPGYAFPIQTLIHNTRDFFIQFDFFTEWQKLNKINAHALICGIIGFLFLLPVVALLYQHNKKFSESAKIVFLIFYTVPFAGLAIISYLHGFNYSFYATHTTEYWLILIFPILILWESLKMTSTTQKFIWGICLALPMTKALDRVCSISYPEHQSKTEIERGFSESIFSSAINLAENDSQSQLDILYFLPKMGKDDLVIRTKMRTMALHFAGKRFPNLQEFMTTKPLNVYVAFHTSLTVNENFKKALKAKFPQTSKSNLILEGNISLLKLTLVPEISI